MSRQAAPVARPAIRALAAYDPGHDLVGLRRAAAAPLLELGSNENPSGPAPGVLAAIAAASGDVHRYPDPRAGDLRRALARLHGVEPGQVVAGNGSHELLMQLAQVFAGEGDDVVASAHAFAVFAIAARAVGARVQVAPSLGADTPMPRGHDLHALLDQIGATTRLVYLANPNNPTGTWYAHADFGAFLAQVPASVVVVVDEAYAELADAPDYASAIGLVTRYPNLVVTRTFSKGYGLAGLRVGYAVASAPVAALLERIRESFNVGNVALAAAEAALADGAHLAACSRRNAGERAALAAALGARGLCVSPSQTNFLLVEFGAGAATLEAGLLAQGIVLRPMGGYGLPDCLRVSVGTAADNARLLRALDRLSA